MDKRMTSACTVCGDIKWRAVHSPEHPANRLNKEDTHVYQESQNDWKPVRKAAFFIGLALLLVGIVWGTLETWLQGGFA